MRCSGCGTEFIPGKPFCHACGAPAPGTCANCGASVEASFRFCPDCGAEMRAAPAATAPSPLPPAPKPASAAADMPTGLAQKIRDSRQVVEGERKLVTVLFCDLVGSTAIAEELDPEEYRELLDQYMSLTFPEIYRYEGIVNQLAGDGLMALFGAPVAHEDAPERAVRAALGIQKAMREFNDGSRRDQGFQLRARIGINTGPVVVGTVGNDLKMDYTAVGDTTNLASRLESLAAPQTTLVSEETFRLVRGRFEMREAGTFQVKGKREPVVAYEVLGVREEATPISIAAERGLTPLVGRDEELAQLDACYRRLDGGLPQVVAVVGESGSGRSRVLYEFKRHIVEEGATVFEARCSALNQKVAYYPWTTMLQRYFDIGPDDDPARCVEHIQAKMAELGAGSEHLSPYLCRVFGMRVASLDAVSADEAKRNTFEAMAKLFMMESLRAPVVLMLEDIHWMDEPSREMLDRAVGQFGRARMMAVVSYRSDYRPSWRTTAALTQITLRHLSEKQATEMIRAVAGGPLPADLEGLVLTKAEGSPFVLEELTRGLLESGSLTRDDENRWQLARPVGEIQIPGTVREVIAARLDRLASGAKRVLQVAAVIGRQFTRAQLDALLAGEEIDVERALTELEQRGVIHRKNLFSDATFRFGESLTQEVAYDGLLLKQRRQLHARIGEQLEAEAGEGGAERSALLAHHLRYVDDRGKAVQALFRAARDAEQVPAYHTAYDFYREAWERLQPEVDAASKGPLTDLALDAALGLARMTVIYAVPGAGDGERLVHRARGVARALEDSGRATTLACFEGMMMMNSGSDRFAAGLSLVEESLSAAQSAGVALPAMSRALAWGYLYDGRFDLAQRTIDWAAAELERTDDRSSDVYLGARFMRDRMRLYTDDLERSVRDAEKTFEIAVAAGNRTVQSGSAGTIAQVLFLRGAYAEVLPWAERGLEAARTVENAPALRQLAALVVLARVAMGETFAAKKYLAILAEPVGSETDLTLNVSLVCEAILAAGATEQAERIARTACERASGRLRELLAGTALAHVLMWRGQEAWAEADRLLAHPLELAETLGSRLLLAGVRLGAGELAGVQGEEAAARRHLQQALEHSRALGLEHYRRRAERMLGELDSAPETVLAGAH
jgi:class 3 adenylate cyclase/tetratricopeptide (TPR) repeat protein